MPQVDTEAALDVDHRPVGSRGRRVLIFLSISFALLMAGIDQTIVSTALPAIQSDLGTTVEWSSWTITVYALGQVIVMPLAGKLSDLYGRKLVFLICAGLFTIATAACAFAPDIQTLIVLRAVQAAGGGAFMPVAAGIVTDTFGRDRDRALGLFSSIFPIGAVIGPVVGGVLVTVGTWRDVFLVNVPLTIVTIVMAILFLPRGRGGPGKVPDVPGLLLFGGMILAGMYGIARLGDGRTSALDLAFLIPEGIAVVILALFVWRLRTARDPFIPARFFVGRGFGVMNVINLFFGAVAIGFAALVPIYAHYRFGLPPVQAGSLLAARAIGMMADSAIATFLLRRTGYRLPMMVGAIVAAAGLVGVVWVPDGIDPYPWLMVASAISGLGIGFAVPASNNASLNLAPHSAAAISGLRGMFRQSGAIISVSIATAAAARSSAPGDALAIAFLVLAGTMVLTVVLSTRIREHHGTW